MKKLLIVLLFLVALVLSACAPLKPPPDQAKSTVGVSVAEDGQPAKKSTAKTVKVTQAQKQALRSANQYLDAMGFSKAGLMRQLTSSAGSGFKQKDAAWALNHVKADWNAEAVESAKNYMDTMAFSRAGLIRQLTSSAGSGFTKKQATYAADKVGL